MSFRVVIPARFDSSRLPGKVLLPLAGKPMLQWVHERARESGATEVCIATDDERIASAARSFGADVAMTARTHVSGTDRIAEVALSRQWREEDIVVNVQGDEPLIPPVIIDQVAKLLAAHARADIGTLAVRIESPADFSDPNVVKVACDAGVEKHEQLRALENAMEIRVELATERPLADVNTAADLERAERALRVRP
jgi:3-deoxy-manno-octulosonate cytidylyltransferase (CMP-KDO synthetase)